MAGTAFVSVAITLDGFIAPEQRTDDPRMRRWWAQWMQLQGWAFEQRFFRENLKLGEGGEEGLDNRVVQQTYERTGASIMGKRMFDAGEKGWPEEAPFHTPVFVLTHEVRRPWERPGGTTFHFVGDGVDTALRRARDVAGDRDIRIAGGADTVRQFLNAGLVDELSLSVAPVVFGSGTRLFEGVDAERLGFELVRSESSPSVTHLTYSVRHAGPRPREADRRSPAGAARPG